MSTVRDSFAAKLRLLMSLRVDDQGKPYPMSSVARDLGLSEQALSDLLSDRETPRLHTLRRLAEFYQVSLDYFQCETLHECHAMLHEGQPDR